MVGVVQALTAGEPGEQPDIRRRVVPEVPPPPPVAEPVDRGRQHEDVQDEMDGDHEDAPRGPEDEHRQDEPEDAAQRALGEDPPVPPVLPDVLGPARERLGVAGFADVVVHVAELDLPEAVDERAVRILLGVGESVVLAVNGDPLAAVLARGDPQDDPEEEIRERMKRQGPVRETPVQVHRGRDDGGLGDDDRDGHS